MSQLVVSTPLAVFVVSFSHFGEPAQEFRIAHVACPDGREIRFEPRPGLFGEIPETRLAKILEGFAGTVPAVAVLVVLAGRVPVHRPAARDAGDLARSQGVVHTDTIRIGALSPLPWTANGRFMRRGTDHFHMNIATRHHLRSDQVDALHEMLATDLGVELEADTYELVEFADEDFDVVLVDGEPLIWYPEGEPFVTVKGGNVADPERHVVQVDAGAISFVSDGADVMRPGIVDADEDIEAGDLVVVVEETHGKTLAIGRALTGGEDMVGEQGKVVESLHHVGDELYEFEA